MDLIRVENLTKTYHLGEIDVPVLKGVSFTIQRGEMVALMGASGSGKTTLMNILGCLDRPSSGEYWLDGQEMSQLTPNERALVRTAKLGFVFQSFNLLARTTAVKNVIMPLDYSPTRPSHHAAHDRAIELLQRVGLGERLDHEPSQMSGGQQQRVAIARSLVNQPALILADEPTGNLDSHTSVEILRMFQKLNESGITVILVTHDTKVSSFAHRTIRIADGLIESDGLSQSVAAAVPHGNGDSNGSNGVSPIFPAGIHGGNGATNGNGFANGNGHDDSNGHSHVHENVKQAAMSASGLEAGANIGVAASAASLANEPTQTATVNRLQAVEAVDEESEDEAKASIKRHHIAIASMMPPTLRTALGALKEM